MKLKWNKPDRPKSAPCLRLLRLKNSKKTSKCQNILFYITWKTQKVGPNWRARGDAVKFFIHSVAKRRKNWPFRIFQHPFCRKTSKNWRGTNLGKKFRKSLTMPKKLKGGPFSLGYCMLAEKEGKRFWFSSIGQMIQFGIIKFYRTFRNYFDQFAWIEIFLKKVTIIVAFHFMKRRLKTTMGSRTFVIQS